MVTTKPQPIVNIAVNEKEYEKLILYSLGRTPINRPKMTEVSQFCTVS